MYDEIFQEVAQNDTDILFTDYVETEDLVRLYSGAKCFVYPSLFEGFGIPPIEALACGTPVAVSNTSSLPEVVGEKGVYFNPENIISIKEKIKQVLINKENSVDEPNNLFQWYQACRVLEKAYKDVIND